MFKLTLCSGLQQVHFVRVCCLARNFMFKPWQNLGNGVLAPIDRIYIHIKQYCRAVLGRIQKHLKIPTISSRTYHQKMKQKYHEKGVSAYLLFCFDLVKAHPDSLNFQRSPPPPRSFSVLPARDRTREVRQRHLQLRRHLPRQQPLRLSSEGLGVPGRLPDGLDGVRQRRRDVPVRVRAAEALLPLQGPPPHHVLHALQR